MTKDKKASVPTRTQETEIAAELGVTLSQPLNGPMTTPGALGAGAPLLNILTPQDRHEKPVRKSKPAASRKRKS